MNLSRAAVGLISLLTSGCLVGFDAGSLTGGGRNGVDAGTGAAGAADAAADMASSSCVNLSSYTGMALPNWVDGRGTWRVQTMAPGDVLVQTTASMNRHDTFVAWQGDKDYADVSIGASATLTITDVNCVLARVQDASSYYALCANDVTMRNAPPTHQWSLSLSSAGTNTPLGGGSLTPTDTHTLWLRVQGSMLYPSVDGDAKAAVTDATLTHGAVGVSTDDQGGFLTLCTVPL